VPLANDAFNRIRNAVSYHGQREGVHLMGSPNEGRAKATLIGYKVISRSRDNGDHRMTVEVVSHVWPDEMLDGSAGRTDDEGGCPPAGR
jgi:hypothetical protein